VAQCSHLPHCFCHQRCLANCNWMPGSYTSGQFLCPRRHPTYLASPQWSHTLSSTPCHEAWTHSALTCPRGWNAFSDTHLHSLSNNSSVHLTTTTTTEIRRSLRIVSVAQKNRPLNMLSFTVPSIELLYGVHGRTVVDDETIEWMLDTCHEVQCDIAVDCTTWLKR